MSYILFLSFYLKENRIHHKDRIPVHRGGVILE